MRSFVRRHWTLILVSCAVVGTAPFFALHPMLGLLMPASLFGVYLARRRRWALPVMFWFGLCALAGVLATFRGEADLRPLFVGASLLLALPPVLFLWPLDVESESAPLPPLRGVWVLGSTLALVVVDAVLVPHLSNRTGSDFEALLNLGLCGVATFGGLMFASRLGHARWLGQLGAMILPVAVAGSNAGNLLAEPGLTKPGGDWPAWLLGAATFALGFDWIRAGTTPGRRGLRSLIIVLPSVLLPSFFALRLMPSAEGLVFAALSAVPWMISGALTTRRAGFRRFARPLLGSPPLGAKAFVLLLAGVPAVVIVFAFPEPFFFVPLVLLIGLALLVFVGRQLARALLLTVTLAPVIVVLGIASEENRGLGAIAAVGYAAAFVCFAAVLNGSRANRFFVRPALRSYAPHPVASLRLALAAGIAATVALLAVVRTQSNVEPMVATLPGPIPVRAPVLFRLPKLAADPAFRVGNAVAVDPIGRGTWAVDEAGGAVVLARIDGETIRIPVGAQPQLMVATPDGRIFVSCRRDGEVDAIDRAFRVHRVPLESEARGLAFDERTEKLFVGLPLDREVAVIDVRSLTVVARADAPVEPRTVAVSQQRIALLGDRADAVGWMTEDLEQHWTTPLPGNGRRAWHGQALIPAGTELVAIHAQVDTGLSAPSPAGGYGGSVREPIELVATVLHDGWPLQIPSQLKPPPLVIAEVAGAALLDGKVMIADRGNDRLRPLPLLATEAVDNIRLVPSPVGLAVDGSTLVTLETLERTLKVLPRGGEASSTPLGGPSATRALALGEYLFHHASSAVSAAELSCASCHMDGREDGLVWRLQGARLQTPSLAGRLADTGPYNWHGTQATLEGNIDQTVTRLGGSGLQHFERDALATYLREGLPRPGKHRLPSDSALVERGRMLFHDEGVGCSECHRSDLAFTDGARHDVHTVSATERRELERAARSDPKADKAFAEFDTPSLRDVGLTAPYFHDGSAPTLEALIEQNDDRMGHTSQLSERDRRALVAYLRTL